MNIVRPIHALVLPRSGVSAEQSFGGLKQNFVGTEQSVAQNKAMSESKVAFNLKEGETSNMFGGSAPLVKERDACGVGFIANTQSGGKIPVF